MRHVLGVVGQLRVIAERRGLGELCDERLREALDGRALVRVAAVQAIDFEPAVEHPALDVEERGANVAGARRRAGRFARDGEPIRGDQAIDLAVIVEGDVGLVPAAEPAVSPPEEAVADAVVRDLSQRPCDPREMRATVDSAIAARLETDRIGRRNQPIVRLRSARATRSSRP